MFITGVTEPATLHFSNYMIILKYYYIGQFIKNKNICYKRKKKAYIHEYKYNKTVVELAATTAWSSLLHSFDYGFGTLIPSYLLKIKREKKVRAR